MDELHGILKAYEMRIEEEKPSIWEETFKSLKGEKNRKNKSSESSTNESDEEESNFVRKLKKGFGK